MPEAVLDGLGVLVTRPRQQSAELIDAIESRGGRAVLFPVLDIVARDPGTVAREVGRLAPADLSIFISRNAVEHGLAYADGQLAAIGPTTRDALAAAGRHADIVPRHGFDTEHLLREPAFDDVRNRRIRIIRGRGGREALAEALRRRGASVDYVETYERQLPRYTANVLGDLESRWRAGDIDAVVVMSVQSYENLLELLGPGNRQLVARTPLVTPAERVLKEALNTYPDCPTVLAAGPQAGDIVDALLATIDT